ncbi:MAG: GSU2403 family nucleotidyltransferase fold protein [bacterium]
MVTRLSLQVQTLYTQLVQDLVSAEATGVVGGRGGTFVSKKIRERVYWYVQYREGGKQHQKYLGPDSQELQAFMEDARSSAESRAKLCAMAVAGGAHPLRGAELAVLRLLADAGVFYLGAVVVGTHAFVIYGNMLGVSWRDRNVRTQDIDIADDPRLALAIHGRDEGIDLPKTLEAWTEGRFLPIPPSPLSPQDPVTSFHEPRQGLKVELLTPLVGRRRAAPVLLASLNAAAQPLRFLDYLIEDPVPAAVIGGHGVLVNVPQPARYALHKLLIARQREDWEAKGRKDIAQADALCAVLLEDLPGALTLAWEALVERGKKWTSGVRSSLEHLGKGTLDGLRELGIG